MRHRGEDGAQGLKAHGDVQQMSSEEEVVVVSQDGHDHVPGQVQEGIICEHNSQFPDLILDVDGVQQGAPGVGSPGPPTLLLLGAEVQSSLIHPQQGASVQLAHNTIVPSPVIIILIMIIGIEKSENMS